jgi:hypothetical protein
VNKTMRILAGLFLLLSLTLTAQAQRGGMQYLGEANVDGGVDHDNIVVTRAEGVFRAIQLRVEKGAIEFDRAIIHYGNGQSQDIAIRSRIPAGGETRVIDLPGDRRVIRSVEFYYRRGGWGERRPKVRLFGLR